jgi:alanine-synthesizing transaminase
LPNSDDLIEAIGRISDFLGRYRKRTGRKRS